MIERNRDEIGRRYGRLVVIKQMPFSPKRKHHKRWFCKCDCGGTTVSYQSSLRRGTTQSCGCLRDDRRTESRIIHNESSPATKEYKAWSSMKSRCYYSGDSSYKYYGARGIKVCNRWVISYSNFLTDVSRAPTQNHSIGRIDNDKDYEPSNVRWETSLQQNNNRSFNHLITINGKTHTMAEWSRISKVKLTTILMRLKRGATEKDAIFTSANRYDWPDYRYRPRITNGKDVAA